MANDEANSVFNVDAAGQRKMLERRKEGEKSKVGCLSAGGHEAWSWLIYFF